MHISQCRLAYKTVRNMAAKYRVLVTAGGVPKGSVEYLKSQNCEIDQWPSESIMPKDEVMKRIKDVDAVYCTLNDKITKEVLQAASDKLKVVGTMSVGTDHVDKNALKERGIRLGFTPDVLTDAVAELTICLTLTTMRRTFEAAMTVRNGEWPDSWRPLWMCGRSIKDSNLGFVGLGRIGCAIASRFKAFQPAKMQYYDPFRRQDLEAEMGLVYREFDDLLKESDVVILMCALSDQTRGLMSKEKMSLMKKGSYLINTSRGPVIDQDALVEMLRQEHFGGVGLDVTVPEPLPPTHPLLAFKEVTVFPHIASSDVKTREKMADLTVKNIMAALEGKDMPAEWK